MNHHNVTTMTNNNQQSVLFDQLPKSIQAQIKHYLLLDDFKAAKAIYDKHSKKR